MRMGALRGHRSENIAAVKSCPSTVSSLLIPIAPPLLEASLAVMSVAMGAPRNVCSKGTSAMLMNSSLLTLRTSSKWIPFVLMNFHVSSKQAMAGLRNWKTCTHLPAIICKSFFERCGRLSKNKVPWISLRKRSGEPPIVRLAPSMWAPNSWASVSACFRFLSEDITWASAQAFSASWCNTSPPSKVSPTGATSPAAKLSRYTCQKVLPWLFACLTIPVTQSGKGNPLIIWLCDPSPPNLRILSLASCMRETEFDQPMGNTAHDKAYQLLSGKPISLPLLFTLNDNSGDQIGGSAKR